VFYILGAQLSLSFNAAVAVLAFRHSQWRHPEHTAGLSWQLDSSHITDGPQLLAKTTPDSHSINAGR
jgi:hypothetical protein